MLRYELASNKFQDLHEYKNSKEFLIARYVHRIDYINQLKDATLK